MKLNKAVEYFGSQREVAKIVGKTEAAVSLWASRDNGLVPMKHIIKLKDLSDGELDLCLDDYRD